MFSSKIHLVSLLDLYICPKPVVVESVRKQLLRDDQVESIRKAIENLVKGEDCGGDLYSTWLTYSGIDPASDPSHLASIITRGVLQRALFDLMLGQRVKSFQLRYYSDIHDVRTWIRDFFSEFKYKVARPRRQSLWWDGINATGVIPTPWVSERLEGDPDFVKVLDSWLTDSENLQDVLDTFEAVTNIVNNPGDKFPVFSEQHAIEVIKFSEVQHPGNALPHSGD